MSLDLSNLQNRNKALLLNQPSIEDSLGGKKSFFTSDFESKDVQTHYSITKGATNKANNTIYNNNAPIM